jgi:hypothetical protein
VMSASISSSTKVNSTLTINEATGYRPHGLANRQDAEDLAIYRDTPRP